MRWSFFRKLLPATEANSESCQTSKMEVFAKKVNDTQMKTIKTINQKNFKKSNFVASDYVIIYTIN